MKEVKHIRTITLWELGQLGLIICYKSGVKYCNQVGGYACLQEEAEGVLAIIEDYNNELLKALTQITLNETQLTIEKAQRINALLLKHFRNEKFFSLDMKRIEESKEAWIHVIIEDDFRDEIAGFSGEKGILTWENSD